MKETFRWQKPSVGVCYYPEHWYKSLWEQDLKRMLSHGIGTIRVGEFSWSLIEPKEGVFTFGFWDEFLSLADKVGMRVILGTPTATPPAWLTEKYPEVLNARIDGVLFRHGARRHYNYNSPVYRRFCAEIVEAMASHYAKRSCVVGWQIDNELNCEVNEFYSESDDKAFRAYLQEKFQTVENLNDCLGMTFWNQTYSDWSEVHIPRATIHNTQNPHLMLEYKRFVSFSALRFAALQADIIRRYKKPRDFITTNGMFADLDNHALAEELDVYCYDSYPNFAYMADAAKEGMRDRRWSGYLSEVRSICPHFGIMEQQSGANGWNCGMQAPSPVRGQIALWSTQSIAHGADYVSYFRWRTSPIGTEIYWHGILDYDNRDNRKLAEVAFFADRLKKMENLPSCEFKAEFAVLRDYDNAFDSELDVWHGGLERESTEGIFAASQHLHAPCDYVFLREKTVLADLKKYKALFYPHAAIMTEARAALLNEYVLSGGTLVLGCRTGYKDVYGKCPVGRVMPGLLTELAGAEVKEFSFFNPDDVKADFGKEKIEVRAFREIFSPVTARPVAWYDGGCWQGEVCATLRQAGKGKVLLFGSTFSEETAKAMLRFLGLDEPWKEKIVCPAEVELAARGDYFFVLNYTAAPQVIVLPKPLQDVDAGTPVCGNVTLAPYATKIYRETQKTE